MNVKDVAVESYFYDMTTLTDDDILVFVNIFSNWLKQNNQTNLVTSIRNVDKYRELRDFFEKENASKVENMGGSMLTKLVNGNLPFEEASLQMKYIKYSRDRLFNALFGIEQPNLPQELIGIDNFMQGLSNDEKTLVQTMLPYKMFGQQYPTEIPDTIKNAVDCLYSFLMQNNERFDFFEFLAFQMFRTVREKKRIMNVVAESKERFPKRNISEAIFPMWLSMVSFQLASGMDNKNCAIEMLFNETNTDYITSDEPVVNLCCDYSKSEEPTDMVLYYPITPKIAIKCSDKLKENTKKTITNIDEINLLNRFIFDTASNQVYANNRDLLERYK